MSDPNRDLFEKVVQILRPLLDELVFVGGCTTGLLVTDVAAGGIRPTKDVDAIAELASYSQYADLSDRLRALGLSEDTSEGAPICRWRHGGFLIDVMPTDDKILGFANQWYVPAVRSAQTVRIADCDARLVTPVYFVATKLEAFRGRGKADVLASHDLEDIIAVIDGRPEIIVEIADAPTDVRRYIALEIGQLLDNKVFVEALVGFLLPDPASQSRRPLLETRLKTIGKMSQ